MNKLIPFTKFLSSKKTKEFPFLSQISVIMKGEKEPVGFAFGRDAFISFLETIDESFEDKVSDPKEAYDNPAGKLIDLIEEKLSVSPDFVKDLKKSVKSTKKEEWIPLNEVMHAING